MARRGCPLARSEGLITEELDAELLVYDAESNVAHALDAEAAAVWRACNGLNDIDALVTRSLVNPEHVRTTLARLRELELLEDTQDRQDGETRRAALRKIAISGVGLAAAPTISSILVPSAAQAASPGTPMDTVTITSGQGGIFTAIQLNAQSTPSGENVSGSFALTEHEIQTVYFSGSVTCLNVTGPDQGVSGSPTAIVGLGAGLGVQVSGDALTFFSAPGRAATDCSPIPNHAVLYPSSGNAVVYDAPLV